MGLRYQEEHYQPNASAISYMDANEFSTKLPVIELAEIFSDLAVFR